MTDKNVLVAAALAGNTTAAERIVREYTPLVLGSCVSALRDRYAAEDVTQEVFLFALSHLERLREPEKLSEWLYGIARRMCLAYLRREREYLDPGDLEASLPYDARLDERLIESERSAAVRRSVASLSEKNRAAVELYYFGDMSVTDVAAQLGVSEGTVKSRLHEARKKLKGELKHMNENGKNDFNVDSFIGEILSEAEAGEWRSPDANLRLISRIDNEGMPRSDANGQGSLYIWRGCGDMRLGRVEDARSDFRNALRLCDPKSSYLGVAASGLICLDFLEKNAARDGYWLYAGPTGETYRKSGTRLEFIGQPGIGSYEFGEGRNADYFEFYASAGELFFDTSMKEGESTAIPGKPKDKLTLVSYDESVEVPAGTFDHCMHVRTDSVDFNVACDTWYAPGVGPVRCRAFGQLTEMEVEEYLLIEYEIKGGEGYFPLAVGNRWRYDAPQIPENVAYLIGNEVVSVKDDISVLAISRVSAPKPGFENDASTIVARAFDLCARSDVDGAIATLREALRINSSLRSSIAALGGIKYLTLFRDEVAKNNWRLCPSGFNLSRFIKSDGRVSVTEYLESFGPYRYGTRHEENRIFGVKPWRYLSNVAGCAWDDRWEVGFAATGNDGISISVSDGGTVTTAAGTFDGCLCVTLAGESKNASPGYYFTDDYSFMDYGVKRYFFAPGVGLVRFESEWGDFHALAELTEYDVPAGGGEYLPIHLGSRWVWDEVNLTAEGYRARTTCEIAAGHDGRYYAPMTQEFWYRGTEEEYENFKRSL